MKRISNLISARLRGLFGHEKLDADMTEEVRQHVEHRTQANLAAGLSPDEARYAAQRSFGGVDQLKEVAREQRGWMALEELLRDFRFALRSLAKSPGFTAIAILIVALGIGAASAMFSAVNALVLRPVALPEPQQLVVVCETNLSRNIPSFNASAANFLAWRDRTHSWTSLAAIGWHSRNFTRAGAASVVVTRPMTANLLPTLGLTPFLGRGFLEEEDQPGHNQVAIVTYDFWQSQLGGRPEAIGQSLVIDHTPLTLVGVLPPKAFFPGAIDVATPLGLERTTRFDLDKELTVYGRLKPDVTLAQADRELKALAAQLTAEHPAIEPGWSTRLVPFSQEIVGDGIRRALYVLLGAVGLLVLIACANLSNLLLVRASARAHELAIRTALGASRGQLIRQIVTESLVVIAAGGLLGISLTLWAVDLMHSLPLPRANEITVDLRVLSAALAATVLTGLFAGFWPALQASHSRPQAALKSSGPRSGQCPHFRNAMVVVQLALSLMLLVGATTLGRSFLRLLQVNPGYNSEHVLTISLRPENNQDALPFYENLTERIATLPGVVNVGLVSDLPLTGGDPSNPIFAVGPSVQPADEAVQSSWRLVGGDYHGALQIPVLRGRTLAGLSPDEARTSVVLSRSLARRLFGDTDPIGRQIANLRADGQRLTVIGVVGDVRSRQLGAEPVPTIYWSMYRFIYGPMHLVVRSQGDLAPLLPAIRYAMTALDPTVPIFHVRTLDQLRSDSLGQEKLILSLLGGFTGVALLLAALGTYGIVASTVQQRTREIGIRIALGARAGAVGQMILGQGARLAGLGIILGIAAAFASSRVLTALLYETSATDIASYGLSALALCLATLLACWLPARRAMQVDPMVALRAE